MEKQKKPEFVVTDRRKFTEEGEPRPEAQSETSETPKAPEPVSQPAPPPPPAAQKPAAEETKTGVPPAGTKPAAQSAGPMPETGYDGDKQRSAFGGQKMEFIHLLDMLVQTAMMYAGAMESGAERRVDVVGLRQMIDLIGVLDEKTRGNLSAQEESLLKNTIFQLRMTYMEIVNMIERQALEKGPGSPGFGRK